MKSKKLHIYYLSTALSDEIYDEIVTECNSFKPTYSGIGFDRNIGLGLSEQVKVTGFSLYPIPSYPKFRKLRKKSNFYTVNNFSCNVPSMLSIPIIKEFDYAFSVYNSIKKMKSEDEENVILISGLYRSLMRPAKWLKEKCDVPIIAIVPDLPELMINYRKDYTMFRNVLNRLDMKFSIKFREVVDGFIFLSPFMNSVVNKYNRPWTLVDGLCNLNAIDNVTSEKSNERFILYAGKISTTFGVDKLVDGFLQSQLKDVKLVLCGDGDYANLLREKAAKYPQIDFKGIVKHDTVLSLEKAATLLVDPRPINNEVSKMSFPSKIIEYMASGTPVLVSNIPSFTPEYRKYQFRLDEVSIKGIKDALCKIFSCTDYELNEMGSLARQFILENKTISKQCEKIIDFIHSVQKK